MIPRSDFAVERCAFEACLAGRLGGLHAALEQVTERFRGTYIDIGGAAGMRPRRNAVRQPVRPQRSARLGAHQLQWRLSLGVRTAQTGVSVLRNLSSAFLEALEVRFGADSAMTPKRVHIKCDLLGGLHSL